MKRLAYNIIAIGMMAAFCVFLLTGNVLVVSTPVVTVPGSYAEQYAKSHQLVQADVPDTLKDGMLLRYETFQYNAAAGSLTLERYDGVGTEIVIPQSIGGKTVAALGNEFFASSPELKKLYLPDTVKTLPEETAEGVVLAVSSHSGSAEAWTEAGWTVERFPDSEAPNFTMGDVPLEYDEEEGSIDLKLYTGNDAAILIPAYINGKPVTRVSFDMVGYDFVAFPDTVTEISGKITARFYSKAFAVELIFTVLMFMLALLVLNMKLGKLKNADEYVLTGPQAILTFLFLAVQIGVAVRVIRMGSLSWPVALLVSAVIVGIYPVLILMGGTGRKHVVAVTRQAQEKTSRMDELKLSASKLADGIRDKNVKKAVTRVVEEIRYSDPVTTDELAAMEESIAEEVEELKALLAKEDKEAILAQCDKVMQKVRERNAKCKAAKRKGGL